MVLGTQPGVCGRAVRVLNCGSVSEAQVNSFFKKICDILLYTYVYVRAEVEASGQLAGISSIR